MFKVPAESFKVMVAKSEKGASCNKIVPITGLIGINLTDGVLCLSTTDTENVLEIYRSGVQGKDMSAVVGVELFSKLIARQTCDVISIDLKKDYLQVKGNGEYKVPLAMDEEGMVQFPEFSFDKQDEGETIQLSSISNIVSVNKPSVGTNPDKPYIGAYYVHAKDDTFKSNAIISTNEMALCINKFKLLNEAAFITPAMMDLLALNTAEKIQCFRNGNLFLFETEDIVIYGPGHDSMDDFPIEGVAKMYDTEFPSKCSVNKVALQSVLDRLALFVEEYDKNGAYFSFTESGVQINSRQSSSDETLKYLKSEGFAAIKILVDVPLLKKEVDSTPGEEISISYGLENAIAISNGNITKIVVLLADEDMDAEAVTYEGDDPGEVGDAGEYGMPDEGGNEGEESF